MTAQRMIELLQQLPGETELEAFDADAETVMPVTGLVFGGTDGKATIQTDEL